MDPILKEALSEVDFPRVNPIDRWWNRRFPPYSDARLLFFILVAPVIALLVSLAKGFNLSIFLVTVIGTEAMIIWGFHAARGKRDLELLEKMKGPESGDPSPEEPVPAVAVPPILAETPSATKPREDIFAMPASQKPRISPVVDFGLTLAISYAAMLFIAVFLFDTETMLGAFSGAAVAAIGFTLGLTFRHSIWLVVALSIGAGYVAAVMFSLFTFFLGGYDSLYVLWAVFSAMSFAFFIVPWLKLRAMRGRFERFRLANWQLTIAINVLLLVTLSLGSIDMDAPATNPVDLAGAQAAQPDPASLSSNSFGGGTRELASLQLFFAWKQGHRDNARNTAAPSAVNELFAENFDTSARFVGCGVDSYGWEVCVIRRPRDQIFLGTQSTGAGRFYVDQIQKRPLSDVVTSGGSEATPTP